MNDKGIIHRSQINLLLWHERLAESLVQRHKKHTRSFHIVYGGINEKGGGGVGGSKPFTLALPVVLPIGDTPKATRTSATNKSVTELPKVVFDQLANQQTPGSSRQIPLVLSSLKLLLIKFAQKMQ